MSEDRNTFMGLDITGLYNLKTKEDAWDLVWRWREKEGCNFCRRHSITRYANTRGNIMIKCSECKKRYFLNKGTLFHNFRLKSHLLIDGIKYFYENKETHNIEGLQVRLHCSYESACKAYDIFHTAINRESIRKEHRKHIPLPKKLQDFYKTPKQMEFKRQVKIAMEKQKKEKGKNKILLDNFQDYNHQDYQEQDYQEQDYDNT